MTMKKTKMVSFFGFTSLFLTLISLAITVTINFVPLFRYSITHFDLERISGLTKEALLENYRLLLDFLNKPWITELKLPDFPMSEAGLGHFYDVKDLFILNYGVLLVTLIPSVWFLYYLWNQKKLWRLVRPFQWGMMVPVGLSFVMAIGFNTFFVLFHELFFSNDDWIFNPVTDPIINVLPEPFFMYCFILFFVLIEIFFFAFVFTGRWSLRTKKGCSSNRVDGPK